MSSQNIFIAHPENNKQATALKAVMKALNIKFEVSKESPYNPEFVKKIEESRQQIKEGKVTRVEKENLSKFLGLE